MNSFEKQKEELKSEIENSKDMIDLYYLWFNY